MGFKIPERREDIAETYGRIVNENEHNRRKDQCRTNEAQWRVFNGSINLVKSQEQKKAAGLEPDDPLCLYVSGTAGTGKSFLIQLLADELSLLFVPDRRAREAGLSPAVVLAAPTGLAGTNIQGVTMHSLLSMRILPEAKRRGMVRIISHI